MKVLVSAERACMVALSQETLGSDYKCWEVEALGEKLGSPLLSTWGRHPGLSH